LVLKGYEKKVLPRLIWRLDRLTFGVGGCLKWRRLVLTIDVYLFEGTKYNPMEILLAILFGFIGIAVGSFLNVCVDRLPSGNSIIYPPSHCDACNHPLAPKDLIPLFSYLWLRGRCRYCQARVPLRVFSLELGTGLLFAFLYLHFGLGAELAVTAFYASLFIVIGVIDLEHKLILNKIVYPMAVVALLLDIFLRQPGILDFLLPQPPVLGALIGGANGIVSGAIGFVLLLIPALVSRGGMGFGDIKMVALIGLVTGFPLVLVALFLGIVLGGLVASVLLLFRIKKRKEAVPFGPFLAVATILTLLWGSDLLSWYLGLF